MTTQTAATAAGPKNSTVGETNVCSIDAMLMEGACEA
jgi:hypothetical protein